MNRFPRVLGVRIGYEPGQVDAFIQRIEATLGRGTLDGAPVTADDIRMARFNTRLGGYNELAVDYALDAFVVALETRGRQVPELPARPGLDAAAPMAGNAGRPGERSGPGEPVPGQGADPAADPVVEDDAPTLPRLGEVVEGQVTPGSAGSAGVPAPARVAGTAGGQPVGDALPTAWLERQAARIERVVFRPGRLGTGYSEDEVDVFLDRIVATLRRTTDRPLTAEEIRKATFSTVVFKPGYAVTQVDAFLAEIAGVLDQQQGVPERQESVPGQTGVPGQQGVPDQQDVSDRQGTPGLSGATDQQGVPGRHGVLDQAGVLTGEREQPA